MSGIGRWARVHTGPFHFGPPGAQPSGGPLGMALRNKDDRMVSEDGVVFCSTSEFRDVPSLTWRGLPAIVVREDCGPDLHVVWIDARGIDTPERFRARMLRGRGTS